MSKEHGGLARCGVAPAEPQLCLCAVWSARAPGFSSYKYIWRKMYIHFFIDVDGKKKNA